MERVHFFLFRVLMCVGMPGKLCISYLPHMARNSPVGA